MKKSFVFISLLCGFLTFTQAAATLETDVVLERVASDLVAITVFTVVFWVLWRWVVAIRDGH